jgi:hypothetical protein
MSIQFAYLKNSSSFFANCFGNNEEEMDGWAETAHFYRILSQVFAYHRSTCEVNLFGIAIHFVFFEL